MKSLLKSLWRWFDSDFDLHASESESKIHVKKIDWLRTIPFVFLHVACLGVIWVGVSWVAVSACVALYFIRMFAVTGVYHRYFSHKTYKTSRAFQFVLAVFGGTTVQRGPLWWAAHHRHHHLYSDQPEDVHSPIQHGFFWSHMGWIMNNTNFGTKTKFVPDLLKYPELVFLNRFDTLVPILFATGLFYFGKFLGAAYPSLETSGPQMLVWGFFISTTLLFHGTQTINSLSHIFGTQRYTTTGDTSKNNFWLALLTLGEGWHNNHHYYMSSTRQGFLWWEIDITYYLLKMLSWTGLIWNLQPVPRHLIHPPAPQDEPNRKLTAI